MLRVMIAAASFCLFGVTGCQTTGSMSAARLQASAAAEQAAAAETGGGPEKPTENPEPKKQSLDALLDEHEKVTLLDDDTGEEKLICRRIEARTGSRLGSRKLCATRGEWREREKLAKGETDGIQRRMDGRCPSNGPNGAAGGC